MFWNLARGRGQQFAAAGQVSRYHDGKQRQNNVEGEITQNRSPVRFQRNNIGNRGFIANARNGKEGPLST